MRNPFLLLLLAGSLGCSLVQAQPQPKPPLASISEGESASPKRVGGGEDDREIYPLVSEVAGPSIKSLPKVSLKSRLEVGNEGVQRGLRLQPKLRFGGRAGGIRSSWDRAERVPPMTLKTAQQWEPEAGASEFLRRGYADLTDVDLLEYWSRRGGVYYLEVPEVQGTKQWLLHRYLYFFHAGSNWLGSGLSPHVVWVELRERLNPTEVERSQWMGQQRAELQMSIRELEALVKENGPVAASAQAALTSLKKIQSEIRTPTVKYAVDRILVSDPQPVRAAGGWKIRRVSPQDLQWEKSRPEFLVTEGTHRFVASTQELRWYEECDRPYITEPRGRLPLLDLRDLKNPDNPIAARAAGQEVPPLSGFLDTQVLLLGFWQTYSRSPELFESVPSDWQPLANRSGKTAPKATQESK